MSRSRTDHKLVCADCGFGPEDQWTGYAYDGLSMEEQLKEWGDAPLNCSQCGGTPVHSRDCWCVPGQTETW